VEEEALIISVRSNLIRVFVPRYGLEGQIRLVTQEEEKAGTKVYEFNPKEMSLTHVTSGAKFQIFGKLRVIIYVQASTNRREWLVVELTENSKNGSQKLTQIAEHQENSNTTIKQSSESSESTKKGTKRPPDSSDGAGVGTLQSINRNSSKNKKAKRKN